MNERVQKKQSFDNLNILHTHCNERQEIELQLKEEDSGDSVKL